MNIYNEYNQIEFECLMQNLVSTWKNTIAIRPDEVSELQDPFNYNQIQIDVKKGRRVLTGKEELLLEAILLDADKEYKKSSEIYISWTSLPFHPISKFFRVRR